ncbi:MAG: pseudouridine synthase [Opitutaceae bacterium]|nr:pseudouridine synthase [Opitutaceae bacterium]
MKPVEPVRIQKFIADAGVCSRRAAETLVREGEVWVNGQAATLGQKVDPAIDKVTVNGKPVRSTAQPKITLAMHKPRGLVCSNDDPFNADTVFTVLPRELSKHRFFCAGRLDKDSEGLVILTTDGELANRLMHPSNVVVKRYHVLLERPFPTSRKPALVKGILVEGERLKIERATLISPDRDGASRSIDVEMHHGKKREIRQLFLGLGFEVKKLKRYQIGNFPLRGIPLRAVKVLSSSEIAKLFQQPRPVGAKKSLPASRAKTAPVYED